MGTVSRIHNYFYVNLKTPEDKLVTLVWCQATGRIVGAVNSPFDRDVFTGGVIHQALNETQRVGWIVVERGEYEI